jgi:hypothetical protein
MAFAIADCLASTETCVLKIQEFVQRILQFDLLPEDVLLESQRKTYGSILKRPLPLDTASEPGAPYLITALLDTIGTDAATL